MKTNSSRQQRRRQQQHHLLYTQGRRRQRHKTGNGNDRRCDCQRTPNPRTHGAVRYQLRYELRRDYSEIAKLLKDQPEWKITVEGHTDNVGTKAANQSLSQKRAEAVVTWLSTHEVNRARLAAAGLGDRKPVQDNATEAGRLKNRRVELVKR